jgi:replicative DNA helicase
MIQTQHAAATVSQVLRTLSQPARHGDRRRGPVGTGFDPLDRLLDGGLRPGSLTVLGGGPGVGKTVAALQWARHMAGQGHPVVYACYGHGAQELTGRLLLHELGLMAGHDDADAAVGVRNGRAAPTAAERARLTVLEALAGERVLGDAGDSQPLIDAARKRMAGFADNLVLLGAAGIRTDLPELARLLSARQAGTTPVLVVDHLQRVALEPAPASDEQRVRVVAQGLKDLAIRADAVVVAVSAAGRQGLRRPRLRPSDLDGAAALAPESDVVILMNDKVRAVSKAHRAYDATRMGRLAARTVVSIEKNRGGESGHHLEFRKHFASFRFDPLGCFVAERLAGEDPPDA